MAWHLTDFKSLSKPMITRVVQPFHLRVPDLQMKFWDLTAWQPGYQGSNPNNSCQVTCLRLPFGSQVEITTEHSHVPIQVYVITGYFILVLMTAVAPFTNMVLTLIPAWIGNHMPRKVWNGITYPFPNFNGSTTEAWEAWEVISSHTLYWPW